MLYKELKIEYNMQESVCVEVLDSVVERPILETYSENLKDKKIACKQEENLGSENR